ncbi:methyltransferase-like protein 4 [Denticeps clupeoides]|nr:methyltransferase-like protein 4 [Denticeps clupeoides]
MSVLHANAHGWLLDACALIDRGVERCVGDRAAAGSSYACRFKKCYFDVAGPHVGTTPAEGPAASASHPRPPRKRKRKRSALNQGEVDAQAYHGKIRAAVQEGSRSLVDAGRGCGHLAASRPEGRGPAASPQECRLAALCDLAKLLPPDEHGDSGPAQCVVGGGRPAAELDLFSRVTENPGDRAVEVTLMGERYLVPARCRFLLSDVTRLQPLVSCGERFDLIVLDPPWENKSVKRSSRYGCLPSSQLKQLPVRQLSAPGCLVVTWVTNRACHMRFVKEELYPHWGVELKAEWLWVKVTRGGEFVFPLDSLHKKPYEVLLLGYRGSRDGVPVGAETPLPDKRLIVSVPSALHSQKPPLSDVLKPYVRRDPKCLEMFARSLQPDWSSWGNEVLRFQHVSYYTKENPAAST